MKTPSSLDRKWTDNINALWQAKIPNLPTLKEHLPGAVLVAFDSEGCSSDSDGHASTNKISELGFTVLCTDIATSKPCYTGKEFSDNNDTRQLTISLQEKPNVEQTSGRVVHASLADVENLVRGFLSKFPGRRILVGYDLNRELRYISSTLSFLADFFNAWVDVQELVYHCCIENSPPTLRIYEQQALATALQAMRFAVPSKSTATRAVNDCCRILQVLTGLVQALPFSLPGPRGPRVPRFSLFPSLPKPDYEKHPFSLRITPSDGRRFPPASPRDVADAFNHHAGLRAVGLNWRNGRVQREGVRFWWLSFSTHQALREFCKSVQGSSFEDVTLCVILDFEERQEIAVANRQRCVTDNIGERSPYHCLA
ncbi:uncharacterized protein N0V89_000074 [Didymosphaeria variabile]|uniref:Uncharacterized protein n=1 Tax=Didymosphaeria variabile TaxID=1932322 RepID=A0A9W8XWQ7_9PLEO|nr:uncharacterized protein N0V89_000074 [Didymosphaeria variabile]KAJ4359519.1 hypothetical protein N0V89_000074 [Didymosphaeria variabile]